jgi:Ca2+-binding EF-hand superfamily protein
MQTEALDRVRLIFALFDADGNGAIEADDFELMAGRVTAAAEGSDDAARDRITAAFRQYWTTLARELDADKDGAITPGEFEAIVLSPERFDATVAEFAEALAGLGDPDGDGRIERPVFVALMTAIGFDLANINALFDALGPSPADEIEVSAWVEAIKDYYQPDKAGIAGDRLVPGTEG